jgi:hypothetical protein
MTGADGETETETEADPPPPVSRDQPRVGLAGRVRIELRDRLSALENTPLELTAL